MKVYITDNAINMLNKHIDFLGKVSKKATLKLLNLFDEYLIILKYFPQIGNAIYKNKNQNFRKIVMNKRYVLIYYVFKNNVFIEAVLDARQKNNYL